MNNLFIHYPKWLCKRSIKTEIINALKDSMKEKGFGAYYIRRSNVQGYDTANLAESIAGYFSGFTGFLTKMEASPKYFQALEKVDARRQKKFYSWLRDTIAYDMGDTKEYNFLKKIAFVYYLANDMSFLLINTLQNITVGIGELTKLTDGFLDSFKVEKALVKTTFDWWTQKADDSEKAIVAEYLSEGLLGGEMTAEYMDFKNNPLYRTLSKSLNKALFTSTAFTEAHVNRIPALLTARRILIAKGYSEDTANIKALEISEDIHFRYGKQHRPKLFRNEGGAIFIFQHYIRSLLFLLARNLKNKEFTALGRTMFYTFIFGGVSALPFAKLFTAIFKEIANKFDDDDKEEAEKEITNWERVLDKGLPTLAGLDISQRVSIDAPSVLYNFMPFADGYSDPSNTIKWLGSLGSLIFDRIPKGLDLLSQERYLEAVGKLAPDGLGGNLAKAYAGKTYGVRSMSGKALLDEKGGEFHYTNSEAFARAMGITPLRESNRWEKSSEIYQTNEEKAGEQQTLRNRIYQALRTGNTEKAKQLQDQGRADNILNEKTDYIELYNKEKIIAERREAVINHLKNKETLEIKNFLKTLILAKSISKPEIEFIMNEKGLTYDTNEFDKANIIEDDSFELQDIPKNIKVNKTVNNEAKEQTGKTDNADNADNANVSNSDKNIDKNIDYTPKYRSLSRQIIDPIKTPEDKEKAKQFLRKINEKYGDKAKDFNRVFLEELRASKQQGNYN